MNRKKMRMTTIIKAAELEITLGNPFPPVNRNGEGGSCSLRAGDVVFVLESVFINDKTRQERNEIGLDTVITSVDSRLPVREKDLQYSSMWVYVPRVGYAGTVDREAVSNINICIIADVDENNEFSTTPFVRVMSSSEYEHFYDIHGSVMIFVNDRSILTSDHNTSYNAIAEFANRNPYTEKLTIKYITTSNPNARRVGNLYKDQTVLIEDGMKFEVTDAS